MATVAKPHEVAARMSVTSPCIEELRAMLEDRQIAPLTTLLMGDLKIDVLAAASSLWIAVRRGNLGGIALRAIHEAPDLKARVRQPRTTPAEIDVQSRLGRYEVTIAADGRDLQRLRVTVALTPSADLTLTHQPRDLYPLDHRGNPLGARGHVEAAQRGLNSGLLYMRMEEPAFGNVLYFQNLTALNPYFAATGTVPDGAVGGEWPELGYLLPSRPPDESKPLGALKEGQRVVLSDAILVFRDHGGTSEAESARGFLQMLGVAYKALDLPETTYRDWIDRAERTLADLENAPEATVRHYGKLYIHPYTGAEYPDIMVQMSVMASIHSWGKWCGKPHRLENRLRQGLQKFFDPKLKTMRRYLPNVGKDKDADAVDSWYMYHPLLNLGRLAISGDANSEKLFLGSIDFAIRAAHHFDYKWPIQYNVTDFTVITAAAADGRGQTDVGGLYAYVMLQAYQLTADDRFLREARAAVDAAMGMRFNLNYQANLTAWGAAACMRLWRITNDLRYRDQSYVYLASFFHNSEIWKSEIAAARHYNTFLAVTCLQDAPYMAIYECFDSFAAFENYLADSGPDLEPAVRMLVAEYCKYALDRAWFYYPDALPADILAEKQRNGHIDRKLSFPLEDLYPDGQPAGQVGQEIYGCGAAFIFATRSHMNVEGAPFRLFCDHFIRSSERVGDKVLSIQLDGGETCCAAISLLRLGRKALPPFKVTTAGGDTLCPRSIEPKRVDYVVPASGRIVINW